MPFIQSCSAGDFSVDMITGVVTVTGTLDAEILPLYNLVLEARDRGNPTRIGQTDLVVRILNIDDNAPRFDNSFFSITVREGIYKYPKQFFFFYLIVAINMQT